MTATDRPQGRFIGWSVDNEETGNSSFGTFSSRASADEWAARLTSYGNNVRVREAYVSDEPRVVATGDRPPLPAVDDLALMLAAADRLWCEDTGDEQGSPEFWRAIASRLDSIARRQHAETSP